MERNIFILPSTHKGKVIVFSPLLKSASLVDEGNEANQLINDLRKYKVTYPHNYTKHINSNHVVILLTHACNLSCEYCYARLSRKNESLSLGVLRRVIDYVFANSKGAPVAFTFTGGGEPLVAWDVMYEGIEYIRSFPNDVPAKISLVTNGILLTEERIKYLKEKEVNINISFDILPDIQNAQRKMRNGNNSYDIVYNNIMSMHKYGLPVSFRTTITKNSVNMMADMVLWTKREFPFVSHLNIWPAIDPEDKSIDFYNDYIDRFIEASEIGFPLGIRLHNWLTVLDKFHSRFCQEDFCITPAGEVVTCFKSATASDPNYDIFHIGSMSEKIEISVDKEQYAMRVLNAKMEDCKHCLARWSCAGICPATRLLLSKDVLKNYCDFTRNFLIRYIEFCLDHKVFSD